MNDFEKKKSWTLVPTIFVVIGITLIVLLVTVIGQAVVISLLKSEIGQAYFINAKYAAEIKDLKSEIGQAYFIEEGTVISASEERQILIVKLDRGDTVSAKVLLTEVKAGCNAYQWNLEGVRIFILRNKAENEYVVLTIFGRKTT